MGRGRLRRGCSLEVIFEEDPDFCSHLDSLDGGVAIRFGIKEPDDTISLDSLLEVEEYQVRFQDPADAEQVFRSLDGLIDVRNMDSCMVEWDEFSMDSSSSKVGEESTDDVKADPFQDGSDVGAATATVEKPPSGRRSRVSRRQIIQATWLGYSSSSDESVTNNDLDENENIATSSSSSVAPGSRPQRRKSPGSRHHKSRAPKESSLPERKETEDESNEFHDGSAEQSSSGSDTSATTAKSIPIPIPVPSSPNLVTSVEDFIDTTKMDEKDEDDDEEGGGEDRSIVKSSPIQIRLQSSPSNNDQVGGSLEPSSSSVSASLSHFLVPPSPHAIFGRSDGSMPIDIMEKDTLDSYISTMTDETDANAYTFADPFDDTHSVASTNYESSGSASSTESNGSVCTVNSFSMQNGKSKSNEGKTNTPPNNSSSKYRTNLKVELVSQLNKSQVGNNLHCNTTTNTPATSVFGTSQSLACNSSNSPNVNQSSSSSEGVNLKQTCFPSKPHQPVHRQQPLLSHLTEQERQAFSGEVKRVRALFELRNNSRNGSERSGSSSNGSTCPSSPESTSRSISSRNGGDMSPCGSGVSRVAGIYMKNGNGRRSRGSTNGSPSKLLKASFPNPSPTQQINSAASFGDILVNENVVIEDAPDIYQTIRSSRQATIERDSGITSSASSSNNNTHTLLRRPLGLMHLNPREPQAAALSGSLRRSQSMGTGISALGSNSCAVLRQTSSKSNILAEELPAPDTVKNVRNVFENMLKMRGSNNTSSNPPHHHGSSSSVDTGSATPTGFSGSFSIVKKSLSYIKSNPTSKIYRSESMRDDFPSLGRRYGKPILLSESNSPAHSPNYPGVSLSSPSTSTVQIPEEVSSKQTILEDQVDSKVVQRRSSSTSPLNRYPTIERKISEPAKFSPKINTGLSPSSVPSMLRASTIQSPLAEEDSSFSSSNAGGSSNADDYRSRKFVHPDVLQKIRSAGTTTTYFGGKIVAKTIKNRKIPVSRRHTFDFQDYVGINSTFDSFPNYETYGSTNYYGNEGGNDHDDDEESGEKFGAAHSSSSAVDGLYYGLGRPSKPALEIPYKSSSSPTSSSCHFYGSERTISGALDSIFAGGVGGLLTFASKPIDTTPRIISVLHKSPPGSQTGSPVKSCSPVSSVIEEGRNSPEGCEASNEKTLVEQDGNNNNLPGKCLLVEESKASSQNQRNHSGEQGFNKKFSQITEGAWF